MKEMNLPKLSILYSPKFRSFIYVVSGVAGAIIVLVGYLLFCIENEITSLFSAEPLIKFFSNYVSHTYIAFAITVSLAAPSILIHLEFRRKRLIDNALPRLLEDMAESQEAGMTLLQALEESSRREYGPLSEELRKLTAKLSWGIEFEDAFKAFSESIGTELSLRTTTLILEAIRLGGDLKTTFNSTAQFVRQMIELRDERESQLRPFMMVIYVSTIVFVIIMMILYQSFFLPMAMEPTRFLRLAMSLEGYKSLLFDLSIVEALFGGLTAGKLSQGQVLNGLKHSVILIVIVSVIFGLFM